MRWTRDSCKRLTWDNHEDSIGHDEHLHRVHSPARRKHAPVGDEVGDELGVEEGAEPADGADVPDERRAGQPGKPPRRRQVVDALALDHGRCHPEGHGQQGDEHGQEGDGVLGPACEEGDHGPGLVHERGVGDDGEQGGEDGAGDAGAVVPRRHLRVVAAPDLVKVRKGRDEVEDEEDGADGADEQGEHVEEVGGAEELLRGGGEEDDEQHGDGGAELGGVVDDDAGGFVVEAVDEGDGDGDCDWRWG